VSVPTKTIQAQEMPARRGGPAETYRALDIEATLDETFDAPPVVKRALADNWGVHRVYVTRKRADVEVRTTGCHLPPLSSSIPRAVLKHPLSLF
jgi:hypothetical protein